MIILNTPSQAQNSKVEISIYRFYSGADNERTDGDIEHTWKFWFKDSESASYAVERCHAKTTDHGVTNIWHVVNDTYTAKTYYNSSPPENFYFHLRGYEDDAGDRCEENSRDEQKESYFAEYPLSTLTPGVWSDLKTFGGGRYFVQFYIRYTPIAPTVSSITPSGLICADTPVSLTANLNAPNTTGLSYFWQYNVLGDETSNPAYGDCLSNCYDRYEECELFGFGNCFEQLISCQTNCETWTPPTIPNWRNLGSSPTTNLTFTPSTSIFSGGIFENKSVQFRVRAYTSQTTSAYGNSSGYRSFSPPAPSSTALPTAQPSCPNSATGTITLTNISKPFANYRYILKRGDVASLGCNPELDACLTDVERSGETSSATLTLSDIPVGSYSLFLLNPGGNAGVCPRRIGGVITIDPIPNLQIALGTITQIACHGENTGSVTFSISGGRPSAVTHTLLNQTTNQSWDASTSIANASTSFTNLPSGSYKLTSSDGCTNEDVEYFTITQPVELSGSEFGITHATCNSPGNGAVTVKVARSTGVSVSSVYFFELFKDANSIGVHEQETDVLNWGGLASGNYKLVAKEKNGATCNAYEQEFTINSATALALTTPVIQHVLCFGGDNGAITVTGTGGTSAYTYSLSGAAEGTNETGVFQNLQAGNYYVTVKNKITCNDTFTSSVIVVNQPNELMASITKTDITCHNKNDGMLNAVVTGGTNTTVDYDYNWQYLINATWSDLSTDASTVSNRIEGDYRLVVKDQNQCTATSNVVSIIRPAELSIESVGVIDIVCFGEKGNIIIEASGGTAPLTYEYAPLSSTSFTGFTSTTPLNAGVYKIQVKDVNNCLATDEPNTYTLTAPVAPLTFSAEKSDYNGFNISCFNGSNGSVKLMPTGGNGNTYSGYTFRIDAQDFSPEDIIYSINAGDHLLAVQDGRGCIATQTINFTQAPQLQTTTSYKKDVDCHGAATGIIELNVVGGAGTFNYQQGTLTAQASPRFENLAASAYLFTIIDENNCQTTYTDAIVNLHAPITSTAVINDALCNQSSDGFITLTVSGGSSTTYAYQLAGVGVVANPVQNLTAGTYAIQVTDSKGCLHEIENLLVGEPDPLTIDNVGYQDIVCLGDSGTIDVFASGGTAPYDYQYVTNTGNTYSSFTNTTALSAATYTVRVVDSHDCVTTHATPVLITDPPAALDFTYQLSDYNGFNISCYGGDNGFVIVNTSGGNGASYTGYQFTVDNRPFQTASTIDRINYGLHTISTVDGRGCVVTKNITLTQSSDELSGVISFKEDVKCFYEETGKLEVTASGGSGTYTYWISPSSKQTTPSFTLLPVGDYTITIADKNNCETTVDSSIASIHPMFSLAFDVNDVNCFDGQDGSISLTVSGGVSPFQYAWTNQSATTSQLENRRAGTYEVKVTDQAGCFVTERATIVQPVAPLVISSVGSNAACYDQANGSVVMSAQGGTQPYQYSIDNGTTYYNTNTINSPVGTASIVVQDSQGCVATSTTTVTQRNNRPEPNFLVSSKQNALDTLVITDISIPKPDSIHWTFGATAQVLNANPWMPEIKFEGVGTYPIMMTSYFGDCAYVVTKNVHLSPFDPDREEEALPGVSPIQAMTVTPNPTTGEFTVSVTLNKKRNLSLLVFDIVGNIIYQKNYEEVSAVEQYINLTIPSSGMYMVRAITEPDAKDVRIIINK